MKRLSLLSLVFAVTFTVFLVGPALLGKQFGVYPLMKTGDVFDIFTPLILIPLYWLLFRIDGKRAPCLRESLAFLVLAAFWVEKVPGKHRITVGADKNFDTNYFVTACREMNVTPHVACRQWSIVDQRTIRHPGYQLSQRVRQRIEEIFGWIKTVGGGRKLRYMGVARNQLWAELTAAAYNLVRIVKLALTASSTGP